MKKPSNSFKYLTKIEDISGEEINKILINNDKEFEQYFYFNINDNNINKTQILTEEENNFFRNVSNNYNSSKRLISNNNN